MVESLKDEAKQSKAKQSKAKQSKAPAILCACFRDLKSEVSAKNKRNRFKGAS
jgi:hypothetical protein